MPTRWVLLSFAVLLSACGASGTPSPTGAPPPTRSTDLSTLRTVRIDVGGVSFEVWVAETPTEQQRGLMFVTPEELAPLPDGTPRGMLFPSPSDRIVGFVMNNTYVPLDLAFIAADGEILEIHELLPLEESVITSKQPIRYALEVNAGDLSDHGIVLSDRLALPLSSP